MLTSLRSAHSGSDTGAAVQEASKQVLGQVPRTVGDWHKEPIDELAARAAGIFEPGKDFWWRPKVSKWTLSCDALTVDPLELVAGLEGIWDTAEKIAEQPIIEALSHKASSGDTPHVQAWIVTSAESGKQMFYPRLATKGRPLGALNGCEWWYRNLTAAELAHLQDMKYYIRPEALLKHARAAQAFGKAAEAGAEAWTTRCSWCNLEARAPRRCAHVVALSLHALTSSPTSHNNLE